MGKTKFKVGDKVRHKGKIYTIDSVKYDICDKRNIYTLKECPKTYFVYSYQLEKVDNFIPKSNIESVNSTVTLEFDKTILNTIDSANKFKNCANKVIVDGVVIKNRYGDVDENTRAFKLTLEEAREMYNAGGKLRELALKVFTEDELNPKPKYPTTWEDYCDNFYPFENIYMYYTPVFEHGFKKEDCDAFIAFGRLIRLRRAWIGNWRPDWSKETAHKNPKYCIVPTVSEGFSVEKCNNNWMPMLSFPTQEMAENFKDCFIDLLIKAENLIF